MAIDRLSSTASLIAALRSDVLRKMDQAPRIAKPAEAKTDASLKSSIPTVTQLRNQLIDIVKDVDVVDVESIRQARTRCIRSILLWEFGHEFRDHPEWRPLMDRIDATFDADSPQNEMFINLVGSLKSQKQK